MRKLAIAGAVAAAALSWAHGVRADDAAKERREAADATKSEAREAGREVRQDARETGREMRESTGSAADRTRMGAADDKKHPVFEGKNNFDVEGKLQKVSANSITLQRDELPAATLRVSKNTKIELDGERASVQQLKPGQDVKASFNLMGDKIEAVEIKADKTDTQKEMEKK
jgi:hypothetical protein